MADPVDSEMRGGEEILIVSGLPRSGTSLMMQMLAAGGLSLLVDTLRPADIDNPRGYYEYAPVKRTQSDASWVGDARGRAVKVVAPLLPHLPAEPAYAVVMMRRSLPEVLASQRLMLQRLGAPDDGLSRQRLTELSRLQLSAAESWCRLHARLLLIDHAELMRSPLPLCAKLCDFVGAPARGEAMAACVEPTLRRQPAQVDCLPG